MKICVLFDLENTLIKSWLDNQVVNTTAIKTILGKFKTDDVYDYQIWSNAIDNESEKSFFNSYHAPVILKEHGIVFNHIWTGNELTDLGGFDRIYNLKFRKKYITLTDHLHHVFSGYDVVYFIDDTNPPKETIIDKFVLLNPLYI